MAEEGFSGHWCSAWSSILMSGVFQGAVSCRALACAGVDLVFWADVGCAHCMSLLEGCHGPMLVAAQVPVTGCCAALGR